MTHDSPSPPQPGLVLRPRSEAESWEAITELLHEAYGALAAAGMHFVATHQGADVTESRAERGECWVGLQGRRLVATATLVAPGRGHGPALFSEPDVATLEQLAVAPDLQRQGIASALLARIEARAGELGARRIALDTAAPAHDLIAWYGRRGFEDAGDYDWRPLVDYTSVVLAKHLPPAP